MLHGAVVPYSRKCAQTIAKRQRKVQFSHRGLKMTASVISKNVYKQHLFKYISLLPAFWPVVVHLKLCQASENESSTSSNNPHLHQNMLCLISKELC